MTIYKCHLCQDKLTQGESRFYEDYQFGHHMKPTCWHCSQKELEKRMKIARERKTVEERMDEIQDQEFRWGEPKVFNK